MTSFTAAEFEDICRVFERGRGTCAVTAYRIPRAIQAILERERIRRLQRCRPATGFVLLTLLCYVN